LFAQLPDSAHKELLAKGYLRWKFATLDSGRQKLLRDLFQRRLEVAKKLGVQVPATMTLESLQKSDIGLALVNVLGRKQSVVSWYLMFLAHPAPNVIPVLGGPTADNFKAWYDAHLEQIPNLLLRDYSKSIQEFANSEPDSVKIQGTWRGVSASTQGQPIPGFVLRSIGPTITFAFDKVTWKANPSPEAKELFGDRLSKFNVEGVFHLDATKSPKTIDLTILGSGVKTPLGTPAPRALLGIYRLEGDTLEICIAIDPDHAEERPSRFGTQSGKFLAHVILKRLPAIPGPAKDQGAGAAKTRNPFGLPDVDDPDGGEVQAFAASTKLPGGTDDPNAEQWVTRPTKGDKGSLDGEWYCRWRDAGDKEWTYCKGTAQIKTIGDRVHILFKDYQGRYLIETRRQKGRLVGRGQYLNDEEGWSQVFQIVSPERLDGAYDGGRMDFRRKLEQPSGGNQHP
jgi:uncharacterized protein (TIGR03067 family)